MSNFKHAVPSSVRKPLESSQFVQDLTSRAYRPTFIPYGALRTAILSKSRFARLPQEPEDAKLTGVTRSLNRRLLALNLQGSLLRKKLLPVTRTA